jgi:hypothetical protein
MTSNRIAVAHWREIQGVIAFKVLEHFYELGDSQKKNKLYDGLYKIYHGHGPSETVSFVSLACAGEKPFSRLYEKVDTGTGSELHIVLSLTRDPSKNVVAGRSFKIALLKQATLSSARPITGLTLWNRAEEMLRNCKKAAAFAKEKLNPDGSLKSGLNADDVWEHVLEKMYEYTNTTRNDVLDDDDDNLEDNSESVAPGVRPPTWYFRGFWTFQLFGPLAPVNEQCALFNLDSLDALAVGRKAIRAVKKKDACGGGRGGGPGGGSSPSNAIDITNTGIMSPSGFKRGIGMKEKTAIVHLAQQQQQAATRDDELEFETMSKSIEVIKDELNFALAIVRELKISDRDDEAWTKVFDLQKNLSLQNRELMEYRAKKRQKREDERNKGSVFDTFLKSVNRNYQVPPTVSIPSFSTHSSVSPDSLLMESPLVNPAVTGLLELAAQDNASDENVEILDA